MRYLHGLHDEGGEGLHGDKPGWTVISEEIGLNPQAQGRDYSHIANRGIGVIVRLNFSHQGKGTIPLPPKYLDFAAACASFVRTSLGVEWWIIGNEPNHEGEAPEGVTPTPEEYARCFRLCREAIKKSKPQASIMPAAVAPFSANFLPWHQYLSRILYTLYKDLPLDQMPCEGLNFHAYTRGMDPANLYSEAQMGGVLEGTYSGFFALLNAFDQVPRGMLGLPAFVTEFDAYGAWENRDTGLITAFYTWLDVWNQKQGENYLPKIKAGIVFRWSGRNDIDWRLEDKPELLKDFTNAVQKGYLSPLVPQGGKQETVFLPEVEKEAEDWMAPILAIDPRIRGEVNIFEGSPSPSGEVWDVVEIKWFDHTQSGGRHHVYVEFLGEANQSLSGVPFAVTWGGERKDLLSNGKLGFDATNEPMWPNRAAYSVEVPNGDTVRGLGMGEMTEGGFNAGEHAAYVLTYKRRVVKQAPPPSKPPVVVAPPEPGKVPPLAHPVLDPALRVISQAWAARPDFYKAYKVDGVPLKGHEGVDFMTPRGSRIVAVDQGTVSEVGDQGDEGYGRWIKVIHGWGETVYAHLEEQWVKVGDTVTKGQLLGTTGATGNVDGPHLHFGLRVKPFNRQDGWGGYTNPLPYLTGLSTGPTPVPEPSPLLGGLVSLTKDVAEEYGLDWRLLVSLVHGESSYTPLAWNPATEASGLGQLIPSTWQEWSLKEGVSDIFSPLDNLKVTAAYFRWCLGLVAGNERKALWCYNWSPRDVPKGIIPPNGTLEFASKVLHGKEVMILGGL